MSKLAYIFPGQGSQAFGMGKDLADNFPVAREIFEEANDALGFSLSELCWNGTTEDLALTENTQPAILTTSVAAFRVMESEGLPKPDFVAGHSLGEYFTPSWLADYVVKESKNLISNEKFTAIDPCCGSGVFVMALIRNIIDSKDIISLSSEEKQDLLNSILQRVKGVDINPLSVLTAKVSFYLSIKPLINGDDIEIPIYL